MTDKIDMRSELLLHFFKVVGKNMYMFKPEFISNVLDCIQQNNFHNESIKKGVLLLNTLTKKRKDNTINNKYLKLFLE